MTTMAKEQEEDRAKAQAQSQLAGILELVKELEAGEKERDEQGDTRWEAAEQAIHEDPLSVQMRSAWHNPGEKPEGGEYEILLCTGGPAVRLIGDLNQYQEPESARLEYQDWGTVWTDYPLSSDEEAACVQYALCFYFGEE